MTIPSRIGKREVMSDDRIRLAVLDGQGVGFSLMKRIRTAVSKFITRLFSTRAAAPKGPAVPGKFLEYKAKAERGDAESQFNLGFCYDDGRGVAKNAKEAVK